MFKDLISITHYQFNESSWRVIQCQHIFPRFCLYKIASKPHVGTQPENLMQESDLIKSGGFFVMPTNLLQQHSGTDERSQELAKRCGGAFISSTGSFTLGSGGNNGAFQQMDSNRDENMQQTDCAFAETGTMSFNPYSGNAGGFQQLSAKKYNDAYVGGRDAPENLVQTHQDADLTEEEKAARGGTFISTTGSFTVASPNRGGFQQLTAKKYDDAYLGGRAAPENLAQTNQDADLTEEEKAARGGTFISSTGSFTLSSGGNAGGFQQLTAKKYDDAYLGGRDAPENLAQTDQDADLTEEEKAARGGFISTTGSFTLSSGGNRGGFQQLTAKKYDDAYLGGRDAPENLAQTNQDADLTEEEKAARGGAFISSTGSFRLSSGNTGGFQQLSAKKYDDAYLGGRDAPENLVQTNQDADLTEEEKAARGGPFMSTTGSFTLSSGGNRGGFQQLTAKKYDDAYLGGRDAPENLAQTNQGADLTEEEKAARGGGFISTTGSFTVASPNRGGFQQLTAKKYDDAYLGGRDAPENLVQTDLDADLTEEEKAARGGGFISTTGSFTVASPNRGGFQQLTAKKYDDAYLGGRDAPENLAQTNQDADLTEEEKAARGGPFMSTTGSFTLSSGGNRGGFQQLTAKKYNDAYLGGRDAPENLAQTNQDADLTEEEKAALGGAFISTTGSFSLASGNHGGNSFLVQQKHDDAYVGGRDVPEGPRKNKTKFDHKNSCLIPFSTTMLILP